MKLDVLVPTYNNYEQLTQMINSMSRLNFFDAGDRRLIIINNGKQRCETDYAHLIAKRTVMVINCEENLGWEGGLIKGLKHSDAEYVCFQNDDVHIPQADKYFYDSLMEELTEGYGMVGPTTTCAAGIQSIFHMAAPITKTEVRWLIGFCVMMKREDLEAVGGVDETLPGGDDFDLSIRMRDNGKKLVVNPSAFIIHHGFQTGTRVKGGPDEENGWNSRTMQERTNRALIQKHGFRKFHETMSYQVVA